MEKSQTDKERGNDAMLLNATRGQKLARQIEQQKLGQGGASATKHQQIKLKEN